MLLRASQGKYDHYNYCHEFLGCRDITLGNRENLLNLGNTHWLQEGRDSIQQKILETKRVDRTLDPTVDFLSLERNQRIFYNALLLEYISENSGKH